MVKAKASAPQTVVIALGVTMECDRGGDDPNSWGDHVAGALELAIDILDGEAKVRMNGYPPSLASTETVLENGGTTIVAKIVPAVVTKRSPAPKRKAKGRRSSPYEDLVREMPAAALPVRGPGEK